MQIVRKYGEKIAPEMIGLFFEGKNPCTGETLRFKSADVMDDPSHLLGRCLRVFLDYENPKDYYVEVYRGLDD